MKSSLRILSVLLALAIVSVAGEIRTGATMQVKADSFWVQDAAKLSLWQQFKKSGNSKALEAYQDKVLSDRDAWQYANKLTIKIISYDAAKNQVNVEMRTPGRLLATKWFLDAEALVR